MRDFAMANRVVLDAMIRRADFAQRTESSNLELTEKLTIDQIVGRSPMMRLLRKPDFQRETNQWTPQQVAALIYSYAHGELIPALILWKSDSFVFVIDGAHRLSALRAWIENDFGDGPISASFYGGNIPDDQLRRARTTRSLVENKVGRYSDLKTLIDEDSEGDDERYRMASNVFTRSLHVQWIQGNHEVAETSFFKINTQGTPLDQVEELLLKNRKKSYAIAARSVVRSGTGHKYWSNFSTDMQRIIETQSEYLNKLLFQPELKEPIKTLDLPLGGTSSPIDALKMLIDIFAIVDGYTDPKRAIERLTDDYDGQSSIKILENTRKVSKRITGNDAASLGLHPAVYFYTERGKHSRFLFLGIFKTFADCARNNNRKWFTEFTNERREIERVLVDRKSLINQALSNINSRQRIDRVSNLIKSLVKSRVSENPIDDLTILNELGLEGNAGDLRLIDAPTGFSDDVKSAVYLQQAINTAIRCKVCGGLINTTQSVSYDHHVPVRGGGSGTLDNAQLLHPFCNSAIKN